MFKAATELVNSFHSRHDWKFAPYGWWGDDQGTHVIFDGFGLPLVRHDQFGNHYILQGKEWVFRTYECLLYAESNHPFQNKIVRAKIIEFIGIYKIEDEIARRQLLFAQGLLPCIEVLSYSFLETGGTRNGGA